MFRLHKRGETPPGMWRYLVPETNKWVPDAAATGSPTVFTFQDLLDQVRAHYRGNGVPAPGDLQARMEDQCCRSLPPKWCRDERGNKPRHSGLLDFNWSNVVRGTKALARFLLQGRPRESAGEIDRRSGICKRCHFHRDPRECKSCGGETLGAVARAIVGGETLPSDAGLKACAVCGCGLVAAVRVPREILNEHASEGELQMLPEWCWRVAA